MSLCSDVGFWEDASTSMAVALVPVFINCKGKQSTSHYLYTDTQFVLESRKHVLPHTNGLIDILVHNIYIYLLYLAVCKNGAKKQQPRKDWEPGLHILYTHEHVHV